MTVRLVKRVSTTDITNGKRYVTETILIENVSSISLSNLGVYTISFGESTASYNAADYVLSVTG